MFSLYLAENLFCVPIQEGHDLGAGAVRIRAERGGAGAGGDALGHGPRHSVSIGAYSSHWLSRWYAYSCSGQKPFAYYPGNVTKHVVELFCQRRLVEARMINLHGKIIS